MRKRSWLSLVLAIAVVVFWLYNETASQRPLVIPEITSEPVVEMTQAVQGLSSDCEVFFTNPNGSPIDVRSPETGILELIDGAKSTIDMAAFEFDLVSMKDALAKAWYRGVAIRVVYDDEYTNTKEDFDMRELLSLGIKGVPDEKSAKMHNKFLVVDGKTVWTGSFNFSENAAHKNNEDAMRIESVELAGIYTQEFEKMFAGKFGSKKSPDNYAPLTICGDAPAEVYFSPRGPKLAILSVLTNADNSIHVMAYSFTDDEMGDLILSKFRDGVEVGVIFEKTGSGKGDSEFRHFRGGPTDCTDTTGGTFHHKVMIIDGRFVVFGSYNFSASAEEDNDENMLIVDNSAIAAKFEEEYQRRLAESLSAGTCTVK